MKERKQKLREGTVWLHPDFGESSYLRLCEYLYATGITKVDLANKLGIQYRQLYKLLELEVDAIDRELAERILKLHKGKFGETVPEVLRGIFATADKFRLGGWTDTERKDGLETCRKALEPYVVHKDRYTAAYACCEIGGLYSDSKPSPDTDGIYKAKEIALVKKCSNQAIAWYEKGLSIVPKDTEPRSIKLALAMHTNRVTIMFNQYDKSTRASNPLVRKFLKASRPAVERYVSDFATDPAAWRNLLLINAILKDKAGCITAFDGLVNAKRDYKDLSYAGCANKSIREDSDFAYFVNQVYPEIAHQNDENANGRHRFDGILNNWLTGSSRV